MPCIYRTNPHLLSDTIHGLPLPRPRRHNPSEDSRIMTRGTLMQSRPARRTFRSYLPCAIVLILVPLAVCLAAFSARAQERRDREPNSIFADRRAKLAAQIESPIILWGLTGREESSQTYIFEQEENFYYLTGHNEEGAGLIILPPSNDKNGLQDSDWWGPTRESLFLPPKNSTKEKWNGIRMSPSDPGIQARTG